MGPFWVSEYLQGGLSGFLSILRRFPAVPAALSEPGQGPGVLPTHQHILRQGLRVPALRPCAAAQLFHSPVVPGRHGLPALRTVPGRFSPLAGDHGHVFPPAGAGLAARFANGSAGKLSSVPPWQPRPVLSGCFSAAPAPPGRRTAPPSGPHRPRRRGGSAACGQCRREHRCCRPTAV